MMGAFPTQQHGTQTTGSLLIHKDALDQKLSDLFKMHYNLSLLHQQERNVCKETGNRKKQTNKQESIRHCLLK
jgi:actin-like ATPase involved in cell morphogenesis